MNIPVSRVIRDGQAKLGCGGADVEEGDGAPAHDGVDPQSDLGGGALAVRVGPEELVEDRGLLLVVDVDVDAGLEGHLEVDLLEVEIDIVSLGNITNFYAHLSAN